MESDRRGLHTSSANQDSFYFALQCKRCRHSAQTTMQLMPTVTDNIHPSCGRFELQQREAEEVLPHRDNSEGLRRNQHDLRRQLHGHSQDFHLQHLEPRVRQGDGGVCRAHLEGPSHVGRVVQGNGLRDGRSAARLPTCRMRYLCGRRNPCHPGAHCEVPLRRHLPAHRGRRGLARNTGGVSSTK